jgi:hypothetical protein
MASFAVFRLLDLNSAAGLFGELLRRRDDDFSRVALLITF